MNLLFFVKNDAFCNRTVLFLQSWQQIVIGMSKTGKQSMLRRIKELDSRMIDEESTIMAREAIQPYDLETVEVLSQGLTLFYAFVSEKNDF